MPVTERPLDSKGQPLPPGQTEARYWIAGAVTLVVLVLALRALFPPAPPAQPTTTASAPTTSAAATTAPLVIATFTPIPDAPTAARLITSAPPSPLANVPTLAVAPGCPPAEALPAGVSAGWLARAEGCPHLVLANINGERRWVLRPENVTDDIYQQLIEVQP